MENLEKQMANLADGTLDRVEPTGEVSPAPVTLSEIVAAAAAHANRVIAKAGPHDRRRCCRLVVQALRAALVIARLRIEPTAVAVEDFIQAWAQLKLLTTQRHQIGGFANWPARDCPIRFARRAYWSALEAAIHFPRLMLAAAERARLDAGADLAGERLQIEPPAELATAWRDSARAGLEGEALAFAWEPAAFLEDAEALVIELQAEIEKDQVAREAIRRAARAMRQRPATPPRGATKKQKQVIDAYNVTSNITAISKALGIGRQAVMDHLERGLRNTTRMVEALKTGEGKPKLQALPHDRRGGVNVAVEDEDLRRAQGE